MKNQNMVLLFLSVAVSLPPAASYVLKSLKEGDVFEGDIVWDAHAKQYYTASSRKRGATNSLAGNVSYAWDLYKETDYDTYKYKSITYIIPYETSKMLDKQSVVFVQVAMKRWNEGSCVRFRRRTTEANYVNFVPGSTCSSHVGMRGGEQNVTISIGCQYDQGALMHELGHVLGLFHEHTRRDRDYYVKIIENNLVKSSYDTNFKKMTHNPVYVWPGNYDYISVMHYGKNDYSKPPYNLTTIQTLDPDYQDAIGQRSVLSALDVEKANFIYNCHCMVKNITNTYKRGYETTCSMPLFWFITWKCIKTEWVTEIISKKVCTDAEDAYLMTNNTD